MSTRLLDNPPFDVACPRCDAAPQSGCVDDNGWPIRYRRDQVAHQARINASLAATEGTPT